MTAIPATCTVVLPCLDERAALPGVLAAVPEGWRAIVVDNGSVDGSRDLARRLGAEVIHESRRGYGAAVHAGLRAARTDLVAFCDCDGSIDLGELVALARLVADGSADLACGRRRALRPDVMPWHARLGNRLLTLVIRRSTGLSVADIAAVRVARRVELLGLGIEDRRFGYPLELLVRVARAGWRVAERDVDYGPRASGSRSKISGTVSGTVAVARDFARVLWRDHRDAR